MMSSFDPDHALAIILQAKFNEEAKKANEREKENKPAALPKPLKRTTSLVDAEWEVTDPCPDIHGLFLAFNDRFFWGKLIGIEVKWSPQMTSCAGICVYEGRRGLCSVRLSAPLLKLRPRSDLVETLLHEMIHAYLFVTHNNRDRDGHGPEFHKHMYRINKEAGTNITVYHSFHAEVKLYKQHWWRCDGPCQRQPPFHGMVKRARNRAPGPNDLWWADHQARCGGKFVKVREPEDYKKKKPSAAKGKPKNGKDIRNFLKNPSKDKTPATATIPSGKPGNNVFGFSNFNGASSSSPTSNSSPKINGVNRVTGFKDLTSPNRPSTSKASTTTGKGQVLGKGNVGTNKINNPRNSFGKNVSNKEFNRNDNKSSPSSGSFGRGGMLANKGGGTLVVTGAKKQNKSPEKPESPDTRLRVDKFNAFAGSGFSLGGSSVVDRSKSRLLSLYEPKNKKQKTDNSSSTSTNSVNNQDKANPKTYQNEEDSWKDSDEDDICKCSVCNKKLPRKEMESHLENCLGLQNVFNNSFVEDAEDEPEIQDINRKYKETSCPICNEKVEGDINLHLDECLNSSGIFNVDDDPLIELSDNDSPIEVKSSNISDNGSPVVVKSSNTSDGDYPIFVREYKVPKPKSEMSSDVEIVEQVEEGRVACPLCGMRFGTSRIDEHVNQCLDSQSEDDSFS